MSKEKSNKRHHTGGARKGNAVAIVESPQLRLMSILVLEIPLSCRCVSEKVPERGSRPSREWLFEKGTVVSIQHLLCVRSLTGLG